MITVKNHLFLKTATVIFEDDQIIPIFKTGKYSSIVAVSYKKMNIPKFVMYSKPTLLIDLTRTEEEIMAGFNDTTRNEIRKTFKDNRLKFVIKDSPDKDSYEMYREFEYSQERAPVSMNVLKESFFLGISLDDKLISGIYVTKSYPYLRIRSIFSKRLKVEDKEIYKLIAYSTRRLIWEACSWGKKEGYVSLDMASVNINNPKTESIARFKMSFGKDLVDEYTYIYKSPLFSFLEKMVRIKLLLRKAIFKIRELF